MTAPLTLTRGLVAALVAGALLAGQLLPASAAVGAPRARASATPQLRGIQVLGLRPSVTAGQVDAQLDVARQANAGIVRVEVPWDALEPKAKGGRDNNFLALVDHFVNAASARSLKILMVVDGTPCWASSAPPNIRAGCGPGANIAGAQSYPPSNPQDFADIASFLVTRYGDRLAAFEVWNEPDHENQYYFAGPDKPQRYAAILKAAYPVIKRADPRVAVLAGSLVGANGAFLSALYGQGIQGFYDGISIHFYDLVLASIRNLRSVQAAHHDSKPLWLAEFGWSTCLPQRSQGGHNCVNDAVQASDLVDIFQALRNTSYVRAALVYNMQDDSQYDFGVIRTSNARKPAVKALARVLKGNPGRPRGVSLRLRRRGGRVLASGSGPAGDAYELDASKGGRLRYKVTFNVDRFNRFSISLPPGLGTSGLRIKVYTYWTNASRSASI